MIQKNFDTYARGKIQQTVSALTADKEKAQHADRHPIPDSSASEEANLAQGAGVPSDTLHVKPSEENISPKLKNVSNEHQIKLTEEQ